MTAPPAVGLAARHDAPGTHPATVPVNLVMISVVGQGVRVSARGKCALPLTGRPREAECRDPHPSHRHGPSVVPVPGCRSPLRAAGRHQVVEARAEAAQQEQEATDTPLPVVQNEVEIAPRAHGIEQPAPPRSNGFARIAFHDFPPRPKDMVVTAQTAPPGVDHPVPEGPHAFVIHDGGDADPLLFEPEECHRLRLHREQRARMPGGIRSLRGATHDEDRPGQITRRVLDGRFREQYGNTTAIAPAPTRSRIQ